MQSPAIRAEATSALLNPAPQLQTVAGFTAFKIGMTLMLLGAVRGLLTSTRLLRGEEDDGRWELVLAGQTTRRRAAAQALAGLGVGAGLLWALAGGALAGVSGWLGATSQHSGTGFGTLLNAGLNLVPPAITIGGIGVLALGAWPRRTSVVV